MDEKYVLPFMADIYKKFYPEEIPQLQKRYAEGEALRKYVSLIVN